MPFKQVFERRVNDNMQAAAGEPGSSSSSSSKPEVEVEDYSTEKQPPRFSTLFEPPSPPPPVRERSGVYLPKPLVVCLAIVLFFESTVLFAYTVLGLYRNLGGAGALLSFAAGECECGGGSINVAPNFFLSPADIQTVSMEEDVTASSTITSTTTSVNFNQASSLFNFLTEAIAPTSTSTSSEEQVTVYSSTMETVIAGESTTYTKMPEETGKVKRGRC